ncbi:hypothetical protein J1TS5_25880 [Paenibacillus macerans]|uniref:hypothetical protein n=1 Tax=Paenibacillus macerans TaxID=44252 RepID=UPI001B26E65F|nr:hypothetical protein [Paenibacillus macerans]GIP10418.1 hypothetical protein J1TS5_25880 [Paenibacillus macerans]
MISWQKYNKYDRGIKSHIKMLVTDGEDTYFAYHAKRIFGEGYTWYTWFNADPYSGDGAELGINVTHYAEINLPESEGEK